MAEQTEVPTRPARRRHQRASATVEPPVVGPGLLGGCFKPLSDEDVHAVVEAALEVLERVGLSGLPEHARPMMLDAGATVGLDARVRFPRGLVERVIRGATRQVHLPGDEAHYDLEIGGRAVHLGLGGAAVQILDGGTGHHRGASLGDLWRLGRVVEACEHIHYFVRPVIARDLADVRGLDLNTAYTCLAATGKPIGVSFSSPSIVEEAVTLFDIALGGEGAFRATPRCFGVVCHVVPPLCFATDACLTLERMVSLGMPVQICSAGQAGATSPAALAGALVQGLAESLAGLVYVNLLAPAHPCILAFMPFISDLRTGAMASGSGEGAIASAAAVQVLAHLGLPSTACAGMTDAKLPDAQAGYEKAYSVTLAAHAGANMVNLSAGMLASLIAASAESIAIDDDMLGAILRTLRGVEVTPESLSVNVIAEVVEGDGHYLGHPQTMARMKRDYLYPTLGDRRSIEDWQEAGSISLWERAHQRVEGILSTPPAPRIPAAHDAEIRRRFPIELAPFS